MTIPAGAPAALTRRPPGPPARSARDGYADPKRVQFLPNPPSQRRGAGSVAMHAQGLKRYLNSAAVAGADFTVSDQRSDLLRHSLNIGEDRPRLGPRQQRAVRPVAPVGKGFGEEGMVRA